MPDYGGTTGFAYDITTPSVSRPVNTGQGMQGSTGGGGTFGSGQSQQQINQANQAVQQQLANAQAAAQAEAIAAAQAAAAAEAEALANRGNEIALAAQSAIMGGPAKTGIVKEPYKLPGKHKLRAQYDYLKAKYGDKWAETTQAKELANYLSGVSVERGGGLGAFDPESGTAGAGIDINDPGEAYRRNILAQVASGTFFDFDKLNIDLMRGRDIEGAQELTPEEYFSFRQQLMAADPSPGNAAYKEAFPGSSGAGIGALATPALSAIKNIAGIESVAPAEYQGHYGQTFDDTSVPEQDQGGGGGGGAGIMGAAPAAFIDANNNGIPDHLEVAQAATPAAAMATPAATMTTQPPFDYSQWPQFGSQYPGHYSNWGPNYVNQGLGQSPNFNYWNQVANTFPGMS